jgi:DNA sulfur modification protein DndC
VKKYQEESLWGEGRRTYEEALQDTINAMWQKGSQYKHWTAFYSGGKDSTAVVTLLAHLIETAQIPRPEQFTIIYSDTGMEVPPLQIATLATLNNLEQRGFTTQIVRPALDERFFVYMLGRGVPPPNNGRMRWCTRILKVKPMSHYRAEQSDLSALGITGIRQGESAVRNERIAIACKKDGGECGQGYMYMEAKASGIATLHPLLTWRICHVWDWLTLYAPEAGFHTSDVALIYGADSYGEDGEEPINARTGCMECNLVQTDKMMDRVIALPQWQYLAPIRRLRDLYAELVLPCMRLRKDGTQRLKDGSFPSNPNRMGPLTMEARRYGLAFVKALAGEVNQAALEQGREKITLISEEEERRILALIEANTWPQGWDGTEPRADTHIPHAVSKDLYVLQHKIEEQ